MALGLSILFNVGFAAAFVVKMLALPFPPPPSPGPEVMGPAGEEAAGPQRGGPARLRERLGLTDEQATEFHEDRKAMADKIRGLRGQVKEERRALFQMVAADGAEPAELKRQTARIAQLQREVQDIVVEHLLAVRARLDAGQKEKFDEFIGMDLCGCPMCDGGCMGGGKMGGGKMGAGAGDRHRGHGRGRGLHESLPGTAIEPSPEEVPGGCPCGGGAGNIDGGHGECGGGPGACGGGLGGLLD